MPNPSSTAFAHIAPFYDLLMGDVPYGQWVHHIHKLLRKRDLHPQRILDLACGTGSVSERLAGMGYSVVGVDISEEMIKAAKQKALARRLPIQYFVQDAAQLDLPGAAFDLCVCLFDSLNYILEPASLQQAMSKVGAHVRSGGLFIFDVNAELALSQRYFDQDSMEGRGRLRYRWRSRFEPVTRTCTVEMQFIWRDDDGMEHELEESHVQRAYSESELRDMLTTAGFDEIECYDSYSLRPSTSSTDRILFVARRT
jgi:SAM-dependent methyltransferase